MASLNQYLQQAFERTQSDERITSWHISLLMSLIYLWAAGERKQPIRISRKKLMALARIQSKVTYHKLIVELQDYGYISYQPSYHPAGSSTIKLLFGRYRKDKRRL